MKIRLKRRVKKDPTTSLYMLRLRLWLLVVVVVVMGLSLLNVGNMIKYSTTAGIGGTGSNDNLERQQLNDMTLEHAEAMFPSSKSFHNCSPTYLKSNKPLLQPPFRIVQLGETRSGSTFQYNLLTKLATMKSNITETGSVKKAYIGKNSPLNGPGKQAKEDKTKSFVIKIHSPAYYPNLKEEADKGDVSVFLSGHSSAPFPDIHEVALHVQHRNRLESSTWGTHCEVSSYQQIFGLTNNELQEVTEYMNLYSIIRQCCDMMMSKYEALRLNGCNVTQYKSRPDYPQCENYKNFEEVEASYIRLGGKISKGTCSANRNKIASGEGFNGRKVVNCEMSKLEDGTEVAGKWVDPWWEKKKQRTKINK